MEKDYINKLIGARLKNLRKDSHLTLAELAQKVDLSEGTVQRYEKGSITNVSIAVIIKFAQALSIEPAHLLGWDHDETFSRAEKDHIKKYRLLPPAGKAAVDNMLEVQYNFVKPKSLEDTEIS